MLAVSLDCSFCFDFF